MATVGVEVEAENPATCEAETTAALDASVLRISQSSLFMRAETLRKLLLYLWAHREQEISEYAVAVEALGRRSDFDPKLDASVRVQISRLRRKLEDFYKTEGADDFVVLHIPMGTHVLTTKQGCFSAPPVPVSEPAPERPNIWLRYRIEALIAACVLLVFIIGSLSWNLHVAKTLSQRALAMPTSFWVSFVGSGTSVKIILPTPVFFTYSNDQQLHVRDVGVNEFEGWKGSAGITDLARQYGKPQLDQAYTVTSDTLAAIELARYLDGVGLADMVDFGVSGDSTMSLLEKSSVIVFGAHATLYPFRDYLDSMNFSLGLSEASVVNKKPADGELPSYDRTQQGYGRLLEPSIVAVLPGRAPGKKLLILQSQNTSALVAMLTSKVGDSLFQKMFSAHGSPAYFEMVVMNELDGAHIIQSHPVAMHTYARNAPVSVEVTQ